MGRKQTSESGLAKQLAGVFRGYARLPQQHDRCYCKPRPFTVCVGVCAHVCVRALARLARVSEWLNGSGEEEQAVNIPREEPRR